MENRSKAILLWLVVLVLCFIGIPIHLSGSNEETQLTAQFNNFTQQFGKSYSHEEKERRFAAFKVIKGRISTTKIFVSNKS